MSGAGTEVIAALQERYGLSEEDATRAAAMVIERIATGIQGGEFPCFISSDGREVQLDVLVIEEIV